MFGAILIMLRAILILILGWLFIGLPYYLITEPENTDIIWDFTTIFFGIIAGLVGISGILSLIVHTISLKKIENGQQYNKAIERIKKRLNKKEKEAH